MSSPIGRFRLIINGKKVSTGRCLEVLNPPNEKVAGIGSLTRKGVPFIPGPVPLRVSLLGLLLTAVICTVLLGVGRPAQAQPIQVPSDWGLKPAQVPVGGMFRLLLVTRTKRDALATNIADYDAHVQADMGDGRAHPLIRQYVQHFKVVGSTATVDGRDHTGTNPAHGVGVPIYWLNGEKVADSNADFYDGTWRSYEARKSSGGRIRTGGNQLFTGMNKDGTPGARRSLGTTITYSGRRVVSVGWVGARKVFDAWGPEPYGSSNHTATKTMGVHPSSKQRFYGLSPVFRAVDEEIPYVTSIEITSDPGTDNDYATGDTIRATVIFSEAVTVSGNPELELRFGMRGRSGKVVRSARYAAADSTSTRLVFTYRVTTSDNDDDGVSIASDALSLNGGTIRKQGSTTDANLFNQVVPDQLRHGVNRLPYVVGVDITSSPQARADTYGLGEVVEATVTFSEPVAVTGRPRLTMVLGNTFRTALYRRTVGSAVVFGYVVASGDENRDGIRINRNRLLAGGGAIRSAATGRNAILRHGQADFPGQRVNADLTAPVPAAATLASLVLNGVSLSPAFDPATRAYTATVSDAVTSTTLTATANDNNATVEYSPQDADTGQPGHQVALAIGQNLLTVAVTAEDLTTEATYTITVDVPEVDTSTLTARFEDMPAVYDGTSSFTFDLRFSQEISISYVNVRDDIFNVTGGTVASVRRLDRPSNRRWEVTVEPDGEGNDVTISLPVTTSCTDTGAVCTESGQRLSVVLTAVVDGPDEDESDESLTARFENVPAAHDGTSFTIRLAFSTPITTTSSTLRNVSVTAAGGDIQDVRQVEERLDLWEVRVVPESYMDVRVTLLADAACGQPDAVCAEDGRRKLTNAPLVTVLGYHVLKVSDARVQEAPGAALTFRVTLSRESSETVTVDYATREGKATPGQDYTAVSGTLTFAPGDTEKTISVPLLDDDHDEGLEALSLLLSNARGARIKDHLGIGYIYNSDPMPKAWLARFGRTVGMHVTDAVGERLLGATGQDSHVTVGGYRLPLGQRVAEAGEPDLALLTGLTGLLGLGPSGDGTGLDEGIDPAGGIGLYPHRGRTQTFNLQETLLASSFRLNLGRNDAGPAPRLTAWGRVAGTRFDGLEGDLSLDGNILTSTVGVDSEWVQWLAGVAVSHSRGDGGYTMTGAAGRGGGDLDNTLTSIHPYLRYAVTEQLDVWGLLGYGWGELTLEQENSTPIETDTNLLMGAFGSRGVLLAADEGGGFEVATRADAMLTRTTSDAVTGGAGNMAAADADAHRLRLILESSREFTWVDARTLTPSVEVGLRHDWGDAETGFGVELGGRVRYADPGLGLTVEGAVRILLAHEDKNYKEWGASGQVRLAPAGKGLAFALAPTWGAPASGVDGLWSRQTTVGLVSQGPGRAPAGQLTAEVGYGLSSPVGTGLLTPYAGTVLADGATRTYRLGTRLQMTGVHVRGLTVNLEGTRQEPTSPQPVNQSLRLQVGWDF